MSFQEPEEGEQVSYAPPGWPEPRQGTLLAITGSSGHVKWETGPDAGQIVAVAMDDLVGRGTLGSMWGSAAALGDGWEDSLEVEDGLDQGFVREGVVDLGDEEFLFGVDGLDG